MGSTSLKVNEPSMEEILASIRRIIADDQEALRPFEPEEPRSSPLKNVLDIAESHVSPRLRAKPSEPVPGRWDRGEMAFGDRSGDPSRDGTAEEFLILHEAQEPDPAPNAFHEPAQSGAAPAAAVEQAAADALLSDEASASVSGTFGRLSASLRPSQPQTVEDLMKEMLRPMLKAWLDDHLPSLVERLVRAEIERVTRCRG